MNKNINNPLEPVLKLQDIQKYYHDGNYHNPKDTMKVLESVNLTLQQGQVYSIIGSSGSGKSTLLHIAGLLDSQTNGEVFINGTNTAQLNEKQKDHIRLKEIGFIYQFHHLLPDFTALENIIIPQMIAGKSSDKAKDKALTLLTEVGLEEKAKNYPGQLSGGQQQRIAIARSLANDPKILLADEPTGNLDHKNSDSIFNMIMDISKNHSVATIFVTHNLELARKADTLYKLENGILT